MQVVLEEAHESYDQSIILELDSNSVDQMEENVYTIENWIKEREASQ